MEDNAKLSGADVAQSALVKKVKTPERDPKKQYYYPLHQALENKNVEVSPVSGVAYYRDGKTGTLRRLDPPRNKRQRKGKKR